MDQLNLPFIRSLKIKPVLDGIEAIYQVKMIGEYIPASIFDNAMTLIPVTAIQEWLELAEKLTDDPLFMVKIAQFIQLEQLGGVGKWFASSPDFSLAFRRINYGIAHLQSGASYYGSQSGKIIKWSYHCDSFTGQARHHDSLRIAILMRSILIEYLGEDYVPTRVRLCGFVEDATEVEQLFGCDIEWNCRQTEVWLNIRVLLVEGKNDYQEYQSMSLPFFRLDDFLNMPQANDHAKIVYEVINYSRHFGYPTVDKAASCFNLSRQQFQRRLTRFGWNFSMLTGYILANLAIQFMVKGVPLATISESLGYKSIASFNKSFKNLRGQTPNQYLSQLKNKQ